MKLQITFAIEVEVDETELKTEALKRISGRVQDEKGTILTDGQEISLVEEPQYAAMLISQGLNEPWNTVPTAKVTLQQNDITIVER